MRSVAIAAAAGAVAGALVTLRAVEWALEQYVGRGVASGTRWLP